MRSKQRVTIAIDKNIVEEIDRLSKAQRKSRSHIIEGAIKLWRKRQLEKELIDGYIEMCKENAETAEARLAASIKSLQ